MIYLWCCMSVWTIYRPSSAYSELISAVLRIASSQISHRRRSSTCSRCMHTRCGLRQDASAILLSVLMLRTLCGSLHRWCKLHLNFPMCCLTLTFRAVTHWIGCKYGDGRRWCCLEDEGRYRVPRDDLQSTWCPCSVVRYISRDRGSAYDVGYQHILEGVEESCLLITVDCALAVLANQVTLWCVPDHLLLSMQSVVALFWTFEVSCWIEVLTYGKFDESLELKKHQ